MDVSGQEWSGALQWIKTGYLALVLSLDIMFLPNADQLYKCTCEFTFFIFYF